MCAGGGSFCYLRIMGYLLECAALGVEAGIIRRFAGSAQNAST